MAEIVSSESFVLLRIAAEQKRAAETLHGHAEAIRAASDQSLRACEQARSDCDESFERAHQQLAATMVISRACQEAMESGDVEAMTRLRDEMLAFKGR